MFSAQVNRSCCLRKYKVKSNYNAKNTHHHSVIPRLKIRTSFEFLLSVQLLAPLIFKNMCLKYFLFITFLPAVQFSAVIASRSETLNYITNLR